MGQKPPDIKWRPQRPQAHLLFSLYVSHGVLTALLSFLGVPAYLELRPAFLSCSFLYSMSLVEVLIDLLP